MRHRASIAPIEQLLHRFTAGGFLDQLAERYCIRIA
jgi:hypothetical protein